MSDLDKWEGLFARGDYFAEVCPCVVEHAPMASEGARALDLACGPGQHSRLLAKRGWNVEAVDFSRHALNELAGCPGVTTRQADLEVFQPEANRYELVLLIKFLQRDLLARLPAAVVPGGRIIVSQYCLGPKGEKGFPHEERYLLKPGELHAHFVNWEIAVDKTYETKAFDGSPTWRQDFVAICPLR